MQERFDGVLAEIFSAFGMDLDTPATKDTPRRFLKALFDSTMGYEGDPKLLTAFPTECRGGSDCRISQIIEGPISFFSLCEHHSLPFSRYRPHWLHRPRANHRHLQVDQTRQDHPRLVVLTASGEVDPHHQGLETEALVMTTSLGATRLRNRLPESSTVVALGDGSATTCEM
jgi:hypothetical protein